MGPNDGRQKLPWTRRGYDFWAVFVFVNQFSLP